MVDKLGEGTFGQVFFLLFLHKIIPSRVVLGWKYLMEQ